HRRRSDGEVLLPREGLRPLPAGEQGDGADPRPRGGLQADHAPRRRRRRVPPSLTPLRLCACLRGRRAGTSSVAMRGYLRMAMVGVGLLLQPGCGGVYYAVSVNAAEA